MGSILGLYKLTEVLDMGGHVSFFLFVIIMEYLNKVLHNMQENPDFNHHAKCDRLQITNLSFADHLAP